MNFNLLDPIDIRIENNQTLNVLQKHKKVIHHFLYIGLLFGSGIKSNTNQKFIVCIGLSDAPDLLKNGEPYKSLGVINLDYL